MLAEAAQAAHKAFVFRWHFRTHAILLVLMAITETVLFLTGRSPTLFEFLNPVIDLCLLYGRVVVHQLDDHQLAQRACSRLWTLFIVAYTCMFLLELWLYDKRGECGAGTGVFRELGPEEVIALALVFFASGLVHWSMQLEPVQRILVLVFILSCTLIEHIVLPDCTRMLRVSLTADVAFIFGCVIGHMHEKSLDDAASSYSERLEQLQREKERLGYDLHFAQRLNAALSSASSISTADTGKARSEEAWSAKPPRGATSVARVRGATSPPPSQHAQHAQPTPMGLRARVDEPADRRRQRVSRQLICGASRARPNSWRKLARSRAGSAATLCAAGERGEQRARVRRRTG